MFEVEARTALGDLELEVSLSVAPGECLALAGRSGAGKTSVLRIAAGLLHPEHGRVVCRGTTWLHTDQGTDLAPEERRVGYLFQEYALFPHMTAWRNVAYPLRGVERAERRERAHDLLERFGLAARVDARPAELSGGERQRVALARALARRPEALLLDEPLSALDASTRASASAELAGTLAGLGVPAVVVTHDFAEAAHLGDRVAVMEDGRIVQEGTPSELAAAPRTAFVADFAGAVVLRGLARREAELTVVALEGGGEASTPEFGEGPVAVSVYPWDIQLEPRGSAHSGSAMNRLPATVRSLTRFGGRARVGLDGPQPLAAEVTEASADALGLAPGVEVVASWKATATRLSRPG